LYTFEKLNERISVCASKEHRFGTDAFLLTYFSQYRKKDRVCDLGTGCGIIPLLMQKKNPPAVTYAVDIQENAIEQLKLGMERSETVGIIPIHADLRDLGQAVPLAQFDLVTCNPPYKADNAGFQSEDASQKIARHEILCDINDVCRTAERLLKFGGRLCLCNRPERLADVMFAMRSSGIEPKRLRFVSKNAETAPWLFLIEGKKGSKPFMTVEPQLYIRTADGYSGEVMHIYNIGKDD